ncbi:MAG: GNAT family N-acetyltransferase [Bacillota bacterium]|nr:GNAT family N-acetyltransferase [Bacillota bacterium]
MQEYYIREMKQSDLKEIYSHIKKDFIPGEYPPFAVLAEQFKTGKFEGYILYKDKTDLAYSICTSDSRNGYVLLSLLAVFPEYRGSGFGTNFVKQLITMYKDKMSMIVEVEKPETAKESKERELRLKRIGFYERLGFYLIPGIDYSIWDISLHLMAVPLKASPEDINSRIGDIMYQIYLELMGQRYMNKMYLKKL